VTRVACSNFGAHASWILAAIWEEFRVGCDADEHIAFHAAQAIDADVKR
jgi:hypothetical protein